MRTRSSVIARLGLLPAGLLLTAMLAPVSITNAAPMCGESAAGCSALVSAGVPAATNLAGDFNGDCVVNASDLVPLARSYLTAVGSLLYSPMFDLNHDGIINVLDLQLFAAHFLERCPPA
jgi:hypothetical protein